MIDTNKNTNFMKFIKIFQNTPQLCWGDEWPTLSPGRLCRNEGNAMLVILNPSPVILNEVKNLCHWLRVNSVKNLIESIS